MSTGGLADCVSCVLLLVFAILDLQKFEGVRGHPVLEHRVALLFLRRCLLSSGGLDFAPVALAVVPAGPAVSTTAPALCW
jgi:hypothetical protein